MNYTTLGRKSVLRLSELALGADNFVNTANAYQFGQSETFLGYFIASERDHFVIATKFTNGTHARLGLMFDHAITLIY